MFPLFPVRLMEKERLLEEMMKTPTGEEAAAAGSADDDDEENNDDAKLTGLENLDVGSKFRDQLYKDRSSGKKLILSKRKGLEEVIFS